MLIQLILWPFDWLCFTIWGIVDMILDVLLAIGDVPEWQPMWGIGVWSFPIWYANELA